ncbi:hypothetical protein KM043_008918 [Ampulex compressa]|nr:hypothetical protein KM043_008918 [Ampulex compressa]
MVAVGGEVGSRGAKPVGEDVRRERETQFEFVEPARRRLATRVAEFSRGSTCPTNGEPAGSREGRGGGGRGEAAGSVNFILPQLRGRQGERTSLAPRPRRPTFLLYGPPRGRETDYRCIPRVGGWTEAGAENEATQRRRREGRRGSDRERTKVGIPGWEP